MPFPSSADYKNYLGGDDSALEKYHPSISSSSGIGGSINSLGVDQPADSSPPTIATDQGSSKLESNQPFSQTPDTQPSGSIADRLINPLTTGIEEAKQGLGAAVTDFNTAAGGDRFWADVGGQNALSTALQGGDPTEVKSLLGATYTGPTGLNYNPDTTTLQTQTRHLLGGGGLQGLISSAAPNLTPGMARYEAQNLLQSPEYHERASRQQENLESFMQNLAMERDRAATRAQERQEQESAIADRMNRALMSRIANMEGRIDERVEQANTLNDQLAQAYAAFQENPNAETAAAAGVGDDWARYEEANRPALDYQAAIEALNSEYADIADIPYMDPGITGRGLESRMVQIPGLDQPVRLDALLSANPRFADEMGRLVDAPEDWLQRVQVTEAMPFAGEQTNWRNQLSPEIQNIVDRLWARQQAYEDLAGTVTGRYQPERGEYAVYNDALFEDASTQLPDIRAFSEFSPGTEATRANVAAETPNMRDRLNEAYDLLGGFEQIQQDDPFRAAGVLIDIDNFLSAQENALEARGERLTQSEREWNRLVRGARKRYKRAKRNELLGDIIPYTGVGSLFWPQIQAAGMTGANNG